ncbi:MAG: rRNA maturation RNase YbeY, partial [Armatimonadota bacterium]
GLFSGPVEIQFSSDTQIRALNLQFRGIDAATDVLTFPTVNPEEMASVAIGIGVLRDQAHRRGVSVAEEAGFLALHAALHLAGYDDEDVSAQDQMQKVTKEFAARLGLPPCGDWHSIYGEVAA